MAMVPFPGGNMKEMVLIFFIMLIDVSAGLAFGNEQSSLSIRLNIGKPYGTTPPAELLLIDPLNRKTEYDSFSKTNYSELPDSSYEVIGLDDELATMDLDMVGPVAGDYNLYVIGKIKGGYTVDISLWDAEENTFKEFKDISIELNEVHLINIRLTNDVNTKFIAILNRKGLAPQVDPIFLGYKNPSAKHTTLPKGSQIYKINIAYGDNVLPLTFRAQHNGSDITQFFNPTPGKSESVPIDLRPDKNVLTFSIDASLDGSILRGGTDYFEILVPEGN